MIKIALGLGHRVLGPQWTFGPGGELLRQGLWATRDHPPLIGGSLSDQADTVLRPILGIAPGKHVMAVLPCPSPPEFPYGGQRKVLAPPGNARRGNAQFRLR
jgi:hypothetical protein